MHALGVSWHRSPCGVLGGAGLDMVSPEFVHHEESESVENGQSHVDDLEIYFKIVSV